MTIAPPSLGVLCFRYRPQGTTWTPTRIDTLNEAIQARVIQSGTAMISSTRLRGTYSLRLCIMSHQTTWDDVKDAGKKTAGVDDLHTTLTRLLGEQHMVFEESWQRLTLPQRAVLRALVIEEGRELMSADVRARHRLPGTSTVQAALAALLRQDIITKDGGRYATVDSLYREWVARKTY